MITKPETITEYAKTQEATIQATSKIAASQNNYSEATFFLSAGIAIALLTFFAALIIVVKSKK